MFARNRLCPWFRNKEFLINIANGVSYIKYMKHIILNQLNTLRYFKGYTIKVNICMFSMGHVAPAAITKTPYLQVLSSEVLSVYTGLLNSLNVLNPFG